MKPISISISRMPFLAVILFLWCYANSTQSSDTDFWQQQYQEMQQKISENKGLKKSAVTESNVLDSNMLILSTDRNPTDVIMRRTAALLKMLKRQGNSAKIAALEQKFNALKSEYSSKGLAKAAASGTVDNSDLFMKVNALNKEAALSNPLIDFDSLLFVGYVMPKAGTENHICDQYYSWNLGMGGGLFILKGIKSGNPTLINVLQNSKCTNGTFKGSNLSGGAFCSPDLSYDGKTILFAWSPSSNPCNHIFKVNVDGSNLTQLTDGSAGPHNFLADANHEDFDPAWLPNGRIVFISDRRGGYGRCHTNYKPTFTLFSMKDDGSDIICLSYHETNEWQPSVDNRGKIVYTRWDYIDRDDCIAHHMWECYPDGRDPRSYHGNYPLPLNTLSQSFDGRNDRPFGEFHIRAIPNSTKYIATCGNHHAFTFGDLIMLDPHGVEDDGKVAQVKRITTYWNNWPDRAIGPYSTPWALSEDYYLCNKSPANSTSGGGSIILRDRTGTEQVIYTSTASWRPVDPIPLKARTAPPSITTATWQEADRKDRSDHYRATIKINNVTNGDMPLPANTTVKKFRIVEVFPKETYYISNPRNSYPAEALARMSLGTAPVEADGSVYCEAPVGRLVYFQLIDDKGLAVASMRSATYIHPGEQMICDGCHENKWKATPPSGDHSAFKRAPSKLTPDAGGVEPINFARLVKPVFDKNCKSCHAQKGKGPDMSYGSLKNYAFYFCGDGTPYLDGDIKTSVRGGSRSVPGKVGASASKLINYINGSHYSTKLTDDEYQRVTLWLDLNSMELGADYNTTQQQSGQLVWPRIDVDPANPQGIENGYPVMGTIMSNSQFFDKKPNEQIRVYRNGSVISINPGVAIHSATIFDLSGRQIHQWLFSKQTSSFDFDMKNYSLAKGTYILTTSTLKQNGSIGGNNMSVKFIIQ